MSSVCVCHLNEWCFYCEMYSPLEDAHEQLIDDNDALRQEIERLKEDKRRLLTLNDENYQRSCNYAGEIERLKADNAALLECVKWYANEDVHSIDSSAEPIRLEYPVYEPTYYESDCGQRARECLAKIGGTEHA
ncbi:hypothetical protein GXP70_12370 [Paenibacillus lycopersici]|uniref:Uncharacterized protein n=1 Tax=Paenibacillus lycopersici TaxID=2704462 RepID=A0A6C0G5Y6_9BACL|nr:hypothetical protein [Paenibacillus lycopersici]QHT60655.1 hypothetical protein GXP70_12370 [Paenibacillus lycopersici]